MSGKSLFEIEPQHLTSISIFYFLGHYSTSMLFSICKNGCLRAIFVLLGVDFAVVEEEDAIMLLGFIMRSADLQAVFMEVCAK